MSDGCICPEHITNSKVQLPGAILGDRKLRIRTAVRWRIYLQDILELLYQNWRGYIDWSIAHCFETVKKIILTPIPRKP